MFNWTDESIRWMERAARTTGFYRELVRMGKNVLPAGGNFCDLGCGPGLLSRELSPIAAHVEAVDLSLVALARLSGLKNVTARVCDAFLYEPIYPCDAAILCNFGTAEQIISMGKSFPAKRIVTFQSEKDRTEKEHRGRCDIPALLGALKQENIPFEYERRELDFSQPLESAAEARRYFDHYAHAGTAPITEKEALARISASEGEFPFVRPILRTVHMIAFGGARA